MRGINVQAKFGKNGFFWQNHGCGSVDSVLTVLAKSANGTKVAKRTHGSEIRGHE
jgi:hypothetical protein